MQSVMMLQQQAQNRGWGFSNSFVFNESLIQRARNGLVKAFLKTECTHLLFIDADIKFSAHEVLAMVDADKDVIAGIYPKKEINWFSVAGAAKANVPAEALKHFTGSFVVNLSAGATEASVPVNQPLEVDNAGTGLMLIKREVFEMLAPLVASYTNDVTDLSGSIGAERISEYFATSIDPASNRLLSEDYHFCTIWRRSGGKVHVAPWVNLAHVGSYVFEGRLLSEEAKA
jgi:hypothetical protein